MRQNVCRNIVSMAMSAECSTFILWLQSTEKCLNSWLFGSKIGATVILYDEQYALASERACVACHHNCSQIPAKHEGKLPFTGINQFVPYIHVVTSPCLRFSVSTYVTFVCWWVPGQPTSSSHGLVIRAIFICVVNDTLYWISLVLVIKDDTMRTMCVVCVTATRAVWRSQWALIAGC